MLEVKNLNAAYGDVQVLWDVSFSINEGSIVSIVGSNGAGKTTLLKVLSGIMKPVSGEVHYKGERLDQLGTQDIVDRGIIHVPEGRKLFVHMTVEENLLMGAYHRKGDKNIESDLEYVYTLFPRLKERRRLRAGDLSGGEQQMAALGRGLMGRPELFFIDEMSLGLAPLIVDNLVDIVHSINEESNTTILIVEQDVQLALENSHYAYVLDTGKMAMEGESKQLLGDPKVKEVYLGM